MASPEEILAAFDAGRLDEALKLADASLERDRDDADLHAARAMVLTALGRVGEADHSFARAAELDPERHFRPHRLDAAEFDRAVEDVLAGLPDEFAEYLENVEIGVEDSPAPELLGDDDSDDDGGLEPDLLGVYIGQTVDAEEGSLPDRVVLFQRNLENISPDRETLLEEIRDTLLHEVGHHFGMDEETLREIESDDV